MCIIKCVSRLETSNDVVTNNECKMMKMAKCDQCWPLNNKWSNEVTRDVRVVMKISQSKVYNGCEVA